MSVNSVSSHSSSSAQAVSHKQETHQAKKAESEVKNSSKSGNDHSSTKVEAQKPTVNTSGQTVGKVINTKA